MRQTIRCLVLIFGVCFGEPSVRAETYLSMKMDWVAEIMLDSGASGSGFFVQGNSNQWFVTARHVLFKPDGTLIATSGVFRSFTTYGTNNQLRCAIDLSRALAAKTLVAHASHDVAVCLISSTITENKLHLMPYVKRLDASIAGIICLHPKMIGRFHQAHVGSQVYMLGFPRSLGLKEMQQLDYDQPLLRGGIIAGTNPGKRTIVIDCASYFGNSGGPVVQHEYYPASRDTTIGLVSQFVPQVDIAVGKTHQSVDLSNSGYTIVEPMDVVFELMEQYRSNQPTTH
jgi:hypothetical protein